MVGRVIDTLETVAEGAAFLAARCPRMEYALGQTGPLPLRRNPQGYGQLLSAIISQQVSVASARASRARLEAGGMMAPQAVAQASEEELRGFGLSRQKARYARALALANIDFDALALMPDEQVIATLVQVPGIGRWTAEIYAMFSLGRADVFAPADLALQEGARLLYDLPARPSERALREMAQDWAPWRAVAARMLWAYYHVVKSREGIA